MNARALLLVFAMATACADSTGSAAPTTNAVPTSQKGTETPDEGSTKLQAEAKGHDTKAVANVRIETIQFPAEDGLLITADLYQWHSDEAPFIVLFHQAGWSRGEYKRLLRSSASWATTAWR